MSGSPRELLLARALIAGAAVASAALLLWLQRDLTYASDEIFWVPLSQESFDRFLVPYAGHLLLGPLLVAGAVYDVFGLDFRAFGVVHVIGVATVGLLVFEHCRRRVGPVLALVPGVIVLFLGSSFGPLLQPVFGLQYVLPLAAGIGALLMLERGDRRGDVAASVLLCVALASFSYGIAFLVGAAIAVVLSPNRSRRWPVVAVPLLLYGAWRIYALRFGGSEVELSNLLWLPAYAVDSLAVIATSLFGQGEWIGDGPLTSLHLRDFEAGRLVAGLGLAALEAIAVAALVLWLRRRRPLPPSFWVALGVLATVWFSHALALATFRPPGEVRYIYPTTVLLVLFAAETARGIRPSRFAVAVFFGITLLALAGNLDRLREGRRIQHAYAVQARDEIALLERHGVSVGVDELLAKVTDLKLRAPVHPREFCTTIGAGDGPVEVRLSGSGAWLRSPEDTDVRVRRFGDRFAVSAGRARANETVELWIYPDPYLEGIPWHALAPSAGWIRFCPLR